MPAFDPAAFEVPTTKAGAMSYLLLMVSMGHHHWHRGEVRADKALGFVGKMHALYPELLLKETARMRAKAKKRSNLRLVLFPDLQRPGYIQWWLLATPGSGLVYERERMKSVHEHPLLWLDQYQIQRVTSVFKPGKSGAKQQKQTWSWSLQREYRASLRDSVKSYADAEAPDAIRALAGLFKRLRVMPMFAGIRDDIEGLDRYARESFDKKHRKAGYPGFSEALPYMTRIKVFEGLTLGALVDAMRKDQEKADEVAADLAQSVLSNNDASSVGPQPLKAVDGVGEEKRERT